MGDEMDDYTRGRHDAETKLQGTIGRLREEKAALRRLLSRWMYVAAGLEGLIDDTRDGLAGYDHKAIDRMIAEHSSGVEECQRERIRELEARVMELEAVKS